MDFSVVLDLLCLLVSLLDSLSATFEGNHPKVLGYFSFKIFSINTHTHKILLLRNQVNLCTAISHSIVSIVLVSLVLPSRCFSRECHFNFQ